MNKGCGKILSRQNMNNGIGSPESRVVLFSPRPERFSVILTTATFPSNFFFCRIQLFGTASIGTNIIFGVRAMQNWCAYSNAVAFNLAFCSSFTLFSLIRTQVVNKQCSINSSSKRKIERNTSYQLSSITRSIHYNNKHEALLILWKLRRGRSLYFFSFNM